LLPFERCATSVSLGSKQPFAARAQTTVFATRVDVR